jgi:hypothetical protein
VADGRVHLKLARELGVGPAPLDLSRLGRLPVFAHHPTCGRHDHHLLRPFGLALCLGCTCMYTGLAVAIAALVAIAPPSGLGSAAFLGAAALLCAAPAFGQPFVQRRWYKIPSRFALGAGFGLVLGAAWWAPSDALGWAARALMLVGTLGLAAAALALRRRRSNDPCRQCPWGAFPLCAHNLPALWRLREASGPDPFLDSVLSELEPLAPYPPRLDAVPPVARPGQVVFGRFPDGSTLS